MKTFGLIGLPLGHSLSPLIHETLFRRKGISARYLLKEVPQGALATEWQSLREWDGFNVTIPYKKEILPFLKALDSSAAECGAVNTVCCKEQKGYNTDVTGFLRSVECFHCGGKVLLLGNGGVSSMMAAEVLKRQGMLTVAVRQTGEKAEAFRAALVSRFPNADVRSVALDEIPADDYDLLLNGTPVGMFPKVGISPVSEQTVRCCKAVFDAVYNPYETELARLARKNGIPAKTGLTMLVLQAAAAQEIWLGTRFSEGELQETEQIAKEALVK